MTKELTTSNFKEEVLDSEIPVLVDFWAPWCGPCRMMGPVLDNLSGEYNGKVKVGKVNVDEQENQQTAAEYGIQGIPAFKIFKGGKVVTELVGVQTEANLKTEMDKALNS